MQLITRSEWGARPPKYVTPIDSSEGIFVHYTVTPTSPEAQVVRNVQAYHMDNKGWSDIAYSFLVGQSGGIYEGRGWGRAGGHTEGWNRRSHAVCWIGDDEEPSQAALLSINAVIEDHHRRYGQGFARPHRAVNNTSCPGSRLTAWMSKGRPVMVNVPSAEPEPSEEGEEMAQIVGWDPRQGQWYHVAGNIKVPVSDESVKLLKYLGVKDVGELSPAWLDACGTVKQ